MKALVTGASGFVGRALCERLIASNASVRVASRSGDQIAGTETVRVGDIDGSTAWSQAVDGVDAVFHLAARVHLMGDASDVDAYRHTNTEGTATLARAAAAAGVTHFIFVSTAKVGGEATTERPMHEDEPSDPHGAYAQSKFEAEQELNALRLEGNMRISIVRPPLVYGAGVKANFLALMRAIDRGIPMPFALIRNRRSLVYVGNLADALVRCVAAGDAASQTFYVSDGEDVSTPELIRAIADALGRRPLLLPVPLSVFRTAAALSGRQEQVRKLISSLVVDGTAIRSQLSWNPPFTFREGVEATAHWYRSRR